MVDDVYGMTDPATPAAPAAEPATGAAAFMASPKGRWIIAGAAVVVLLAIVGAVLAVFVMSTGSKSVTPPATPTTSGGSLTSTATAEVTETPAPKVPISNADVFSFRDPFVALIIQQPPAEAPSTTTTTTSTSSTTKTTTSGGDANTITLHDVVTEDGKAVAVLTLGDTEYRLSKGQSIPNTPWEVLDISGHTVIMLYGDDRVSLSVGQALSK